MKFRFSEDIWEKISLLWDKERRQEAEEPDYSDKQVKELMKTLFLVRRAYKPGKKQTYDMRQAWSNVVSRTKQRNTRKLLKLPAKKEQYFPTQLYPLHHKRTCKNHLF